MLPFVLLALAASTAAHAECDLPISTADIQSILERAESTYTALDVPAFQEMTDELSAGLACLQEPVPRYLAASVHRMMGLRAFIEREPERSTRAFAAARSIEPAYTFPEAMVPAGNPMLSTYAAIPIETGSYEELPVSAEGHYLIDGRAGTQRPTAWPVIFQRVGGDGQVQHTTYVWNGEPIPGLEIPSPTPIAASEPTQPPLPATPSAPLAAGERVGPRWGLLGSAGASLVAAGALYGVASASHSKWSDPDTDPMDKPSLRTSTNACFVGSIALGAAGLGLGTAAFLEVRW